MTDEEFIALEPPHTLDALAKISDQAERSRLRTLYARTRGMLVDGSGLAHARPFDPTRAPQTSRAGVRSPAPDSGMLIGGRLLFFVGVIVAIVSGFSLSSGEGFGVTAIAILAIYVSIGVSGLGAFMWMLGAIEQRLIEIRELTRTT